jgi:hypothetical protein
MKWKLAASLLLCTWFCALSASAQDAEPAPPPPSYGDEPVEQAPPPHPDLPPPPELQPSSPYAPAPPDAVPVGAERHDGFYLRVGLGIGGLALERSTDKELFERDPDSKSSIRGGGGVFELSIGGTPAEGLVIAGTLLSHSVADPTVKYDGGEEVELSDPLVFALLGGTVDWYPNAHGGFHFGGTLGVAAAVVERSEGTADIGGAGLGLSALAGYDWWVGDEWSLGVLGRLSGARVRGEPTETVGDRELDGQEDSTVAALGVMFSVLHH